MPVFSIAHIIFEFIIYLLLYFALGCDMQGGKCEEWLKIHFKQDTKWQSNPIDMDTEGAIGSVYIYQAGAVQ